MDQSIEYGVNMSKKIDEVMGNTEEDFDGAESADAEEDFDEVEAADPEEDSEA